MSYHFIDIPKFVPVESYHTAIDRMVKHLLSTGIVKGVYQVGGITSPGISDIDLYVVFENDISSLANPVKDLSYPDNYLFTHRLFGTCEENAVKLEQFTFFSKYNFLGGNESALLNYSASEEETSILKHQIALEYLIKAWYSNAIGMEFGTVKLRNLLLHAKAIKLDLEFLGIREGNLVSNIAEILEVRSAWFQKPASAKTLTRLVKEYDAGLAEEIRNAISRFGFFVPDNANFQLSKRIDLRTLEQLQLIRNGLLLPNALTRLSGKLFKMQNKLNSFSVGIPISKNNIPPILLERQRQMKTAFAYNHAHLPGFLCTGHGMNIFDKEN